MHVAFGSKHIFTDVQYMNSPRFFTFARLLVCSFAKRDKVSLNEEAKMNPLKYQLSRFVCSLLDESRSTYRWIDVFHAHLL